MERTAINPAGVAAPVSDYSHSVRIDLGDAALIFVSGQVAVDEGGALVGKGDFGAQTERVFENLRLVLEGSGATMSDVVKLTIFVTDTSERAKFVEVRARYFSAAPPASTFVQVSKLASDDWLVEIEAVAVARR